MKLEKKKITVFYKVLKQPWVYSKYLYSAVAYSRGKGKGDERRFLGIQGWEVWRDGRKIYHSQRRNKVVKSDETTFFFSRFPGESRVSYLWGIFQRWGRVCDLVILKRRDSQRRKEREEIQKQSFVQHKGKEKVECRRKNKRKLLPNVNQLIKVAPDAKSTTLGTTPGVAGEKSTRASWYLEGTEHQNCI